MKSFIHAREYFYKLMSTLSSSIWRTTWIWTFLYFNVVWTLTLVDNKLLLFPWVLAPEWTPVLIVFIKMAELYTMLEFLVLFAEFVLLILFTSVCCWAVFSIYLQKRLLLWIQLNNILGIRLLYMLIRSSERRRLKFRSYNSTFPFYSTTFFSDNKNKFSHPRRQILRRFPLKAKFFHQITFYC